MKRLITLGILIISTLFFPPKVNASSGDWGTVQGTVLSYGAVQYPIVGVAIRLYFYADSTTTTTFSGVDGTYQAVVAEGFYKISCGGEGTVPQSVDSVYVVGGETVIVDFILKEFPYPASNVLVEINHRNNLPFITWNNRNSLLPDYNDNVRAFTRAFARYKVYRLLEGDELIPENWTLLYDNVLEPFCYDTEWLSIDTGTYRYAVISAYSYNAAEPAFSNLIWNGLNVTVNIINGTGGSPEGAVISLINQDNNPEHRYDALAPLNDPVRFTDVWPGIYELNVLLDDNDPYCLQNISVFGNITIDVMMLGWFFAPGLYINYFTNELCVIPPDWNYNTIYYKGFEDGIIPFGWTQEFIDSTLLWTVQTGSPSGFPDHAHSGVFNASFIGGSASTALISPKLNLQNTIRPKLSFWHAEAGDSVRDVLKIKYKSSTNGIWKPLYSSHYQTNWGRQWLNLPSPSANYYIGFFGEAKPGGLGICLDDIKIMDVDTAVEAPSNFLGYNLYFNGNVLFLTSDLCVSLDTLTPENTYIFGVNAQYTGGSSINVTFTFTYIPCYYLKPPPENFTGSVNGMEVTLEWDHPSETGPEEYDIIYDNGSQPFDLIGYNIWRDDIRLNNEIYTDTLYVDVPSPGGVYNYNITAVYDVFGESCLLDSAFTAMVGENFSPPQELTAQLTDDETVLLTWNAPEAYLGKNHQGSPEPVLQGYNLWRNNYNIRYIPDPDTFVVDTIFFVGLYDYYLSALYDEGESWPEGPANIIVIGKGTLEGDVFDAIEFKPIEGVTVTLNPGGYSAVTESDGSYRNDEIPQGVYEVTFSANEYYPDSVGVVQIIYGESKQVNMSLFRETAKFLPFTEPWDDGAFEAQHWYFTPEQGKWHINQNSGHPYPAAEFTWEPGIANYSFALVSPFIISKGLSAIIYLTFETKVHDYGSLGLETLSVEIWNGIYWTPIALLENNTGTEWIKHTFNISSYFRDSYMKVRFMVSGLEQYYLTTWQVDNVNVFIPTTANQEGDLLEDQQLRTTISEIKEGNLPVIYPNPASNQLTVSGLQQIEATSASIGSSILRYLSFYDLYGRRVNEVIIPPEQSVIHIDISDLPEGLYVVQFMLGNGKSVVEKVIIMR